jgi:tetratricopeptide (TPR) repeat protein
MRIDGLNSQIPNVNNEPHKVEQKDVKQKEFSEVIRLKDGVSRGVNLPKNISREMITDFAEHYFKAGKTYESLKSYRQAISAYEKSNVVEPTLEKAKSVLQARKRQFGE